MKSFEGYLKKKLGDSYVLLAGGGEKSLNDFMLVSPYYYPSNMPSENEPSSSYFGTDSRYNYVNSFFSNGWPNSWEYADILNWTGYLLYGGTLLAVEYCTDAPGIALRTWYYPQSRWGNWINIITSANIASLSVASANKLTTVSKTAWGCTYWTSGGVPTDIPITSVAKMPYVLFKNYDNDDNAGYCGRGASGHNGILLESYTDSVIRISNTKGNINITSSGNVSIGATTASYKLSVNGNFGTSDFYTGTDGSGFFIEGFSSTGFRMLYPKTISGNSKSNYDVLLMKNGVLTFNGYTLWHSNNDGSNSGLDADLLDGKHASAFALAVHEHNYITTPYPCTGHSTYNIEGESINDSISSRTLNRSSLGSLFPAFHYTDWGWSDTLYWSGYSHWGGTELATEYNTKNNTRVKIRKWSQTNGGEWGNWTEFITSGNISSLSVDSLTTTSKSAFGLTYWNASGKPIDIPITAVGTMRYLYFRNKDNNGYAGHVGRGGSSNEIQLCAYSGNALDLGANNGGGHIHIATNGYVGIGTTDPSYKLDVNGLLGINSNGCHAYIGAANTSWFYIETTDRNIYIHPNVLVDGYLSSYSNGVNDLGLSNKYWNHLYCNYINGNNTFVHSGNIANLNVLSAKYLTSPYKYTGLSTYNVDGQSITDAMGSESLCKDYNGTVLVAFHSTDWGWSDTLYFSGYGKWGGTELATQYNAGSNVRVKIRKFYLGTNTWGSWTEFITNGNITNYYWADKAIGTSANYLTTPTVCYLLFRNTANSGSAGYVGRGSGSSNEILLCGYSGAAVNIGANNGSGHIYVNTSGNVGIGTTSISYKLQINGNAAATNFYTTSDRSKKQNISSFSEHIRKFQLKDTEKWHYGVIAQEVPEMFRDGEEGNMTVNYNSVLSYYVGLLENRVKELEDKLKKYEEIQNI